MHPSSHFQWFPPGTLKMMNFKNGPWGILCGNTLGVGDKTLSK